MQMWQSCPREATRYVAPEEAASSGNEAAAALSSSMSVPLLDVSGALSDVCCFALLRAIHHPLQKVPYYDAQHQTGGRIARACCRLASTGLCNQYRVCEHGADSPGIKSHSSHPRTMALTPGHDPLLRHTEYCHKVILAASSHACPVSTPRTACRVAIVDLHSHAKRHLPAPAPHMT